MHFATAQYVTYELWDYQCSFHSKYSGPYNPIGNTTENNDLYFI